MKKIIFWFIAIFCCHDCKAQFSDSTNYYVNFNSGGNINKTQDGNSYFLTNGLKFSMRRKKISLNLGNTWLYGKQNANLTNNDYTATLDFNVYTNIPHFYYWGLGNYTTSYSLKIINQLQAGAGLAYNILDRKNAWLNLSDGILYETSNIYLEDSTRDDYHTYRNSLRLAFRFSMGKDAVVIDGSSFFQNSLTHGDDYILRSTENLNIKIKKGLSFTTSFNYNTIRRTRRENLLLSYGLTYQRYF